MEVLRCLTTMSLCHPFARLFAHYIPQLSQHLSPLAQVLAGVVEARPGMDWWAYPTSTYAVPCTKTPWRFKGFQVDLMAVLHAALAEHHPCFPLLPPTLAPIWPCPAACIGFYTLLCCSFGVCEAHGDRLELRGAGALVSATYPFRPAPRGAGAMVTGSL